MSQDSKTISGAQSGSAYTSDLNEALASLNSSNSGDAAPTQDIVEGTLWYETDTDTMRVREGSAFVPMIKPATGGLMTVSGSNVGIGATAPSALLHLDKTQNAPNELKLSNNRQDLGNSPTFDVVGQNGGANTSKIRFYRGSGSSTGFLTFETRANNSDTDTTERMRITSNGNVGIGTDSPGFKLDVQDSVASGYSQSASFTNTDGTGFVNTQWKVGTASSTIRYAPGVFFKIGPDAADTTTPLVFTTNNSTERMRILSNGNVGIGTSSPTGNLDVRKDNATVTSKIMASTTGFDAELWLGRNDTRKCTIVAKQLSANSDHDMVFSTNAGSADATEKMRIDSVGNVGIGLTNPSHPLDVVGVVRASEFLVDAVDIDSNGTGWRRIATRTGAAGRGGAEIRLFTTGGSFNPVATTFKIFSNYADEAGILITSESTNSDQYWSQARMIDDSAGNYHFEVNFTTDVTGNLHSSITNLGDELGRYTLATGALVTGTTSANLVQRAIATVGRLNVAEGALYVDDNRNVGIGTASPSYPLDVVTTSGDLSMRLRTTDTASTADTIFRNQISSGGGSNYIWFGDLADSDIGQIRYQHSNDSMQFKTNTAEAMRIDSTGNVGVGTSSPEERLHSRKDSTANTYIRHDNLNGGTNANAGLRLRTNNGNWDLIAKRSENALAIDSPSSGEIVRFTTTGVGIGVTGPQDKLQVDGSILVRGNGAAGTLYGVRILTGGSTENGGEIQLLDRNGNTRGLIDFQDGDADGYGDLRFLNLGNDAASRVNIGTTGALADGVFFQTRGAERVRIDKNGLLLVGKSSTGTTGTGLEFRPGASTQMIMGKTTSGTVNGLLFYHSGTYVGGLNYTNTSTALVTSSDYRLKENVVAITDSIDRLMDLKPSRFNFIAEPDVTVDGFIAHEAQEVVPEAVSGTKDAVDEDGEPDYQGIDHSKLVPLLVAAVQDQQTIINDLIARIETLES